jgi:hypothetical protein
LKKTKLKKRKKRWLVDAQAHSLKPSAGKRIRNRLYRNLENKAAFTVALQIKLVSVHAPYFADANC